MNYSYLVRCISKQDPQRRTFVSWLVSPVSPCRWPKLFYHFLFGVHHRRDEDAASELVLRTRRDHKGAVWERVVNLFIKPIYPDSAKCVHRFWFGKKALRFSQDHLGSSPRNNASTRFQCTLFYTQLFFGFPTAHPCMRSEGTFISQFCLWTRQPQWITTVPKWLKWLVFEYFHCQTSNMSEGFANKKIPLNPLCRRVCIRD